MHSSKFAQDYSYLFNDDDLVVPGAQNSAKLTMGHKKYDSTNSMPHQNLRNILS